MNTMQRRQIAKSQVVDLSVAKVALHKSLRQRAEATKALRKAASIARLASSPETISYPSHVNE